MSMILPNRRSMRQPRIESLEVRQNMTSFVGPLPISNQAVTQSTVLHAADLDEDGDMDMIATSYDKDQVLVYLNTDGKGTFGPSIVLPDRSRLLDGPGKIATADFDGDGHTDIAVTGYQNGSVAVFRNLGNLFGSGLSFADAAPVLTSAENAWSIEAVDLDGDSKQDLLITAQGYNLGWVRNLSSPSTGIQFNTALVSISTQDYAEATATGDFDGDGDIDIITAGAYALIKLQRLNNGSFSRTVISEQNNYVSLKTADFDRDGHLDVAAVSASGNLLDLYLNTKGNGTFTLKRITNQLDRPRELSVGDIDNDGWTDIVVASQDDNSVQVFENGGTTGNWRLRLVSRQASLPRDVVFADLNGDGYVDLGVASPGSNRLAWYDNRLIGDVNRDRRFDSSDLVRIFQAGKYENAIANDATFEQGDWNGDGEFDSRDLVAAFTEGHYQV